MLAREPVPATPATETIVHNTLNTRQMYLLIQKVDAITTDDGYLTESSGLHRWTHDSAAVAFTEQLKAAGELDDKIITVANIRSALTALDYEWHRRPPRMVKGPEDRPDLLSAVYPPLRQDVDDILAYLTRVNPNWKQD